MCRDSAGLMLALSASGDDSRETDQASAAPEYDGQKGCDL
jgi:hypothetical protein